jgi:hypothetical protein
VEPLNNSEFGLVKSNTVGAMCMATTMGPKPRVFATPVAGNTIHGNLERQGNTSVADFGNPDTVDGHKRANAPGFD